MNAPQAKFSTLKVHGFFRDWVFAVVLAAGLNLGLFGLMPGLIQSVPSSPDLSDPQAPVRVIRVKRSEPPPKKQRPEPVVRHTPEKPMAKKPAVPREVVSRPRLTAPALDLGTPLLPPARLDIHAPLLDHPALEVPALKPSYEIGELDRGLTAISSIQPTYPFKAKRRGIEGQVTVEFLVTSQGLVREVTIVKAEPEKIFEQAVVNALGLWRFQPPTVEGIPVSARVRTTILFQLEDRQ